MIKKQNLYRPKSRKQLACEYGVSTRTLRRWFKSKNLIMPPSLLLPKDLELIYNVLGDPQSGQNE